MLTKCDPLTREMTFSLDIIEKLYEAASTNCSPDADRTRSGAQNLRGAPDFSGAHILACEKENFIWSTNFQSNR